MANPIKDLTGKRFGRLTVLRNTGIRAVRKNGAKCGYIWECKCDCGNIIMREGTLLTSGVTKSCGCYHSEIVSDKMRGNNLVGSVFGNLKVIKFVPISERIPKYKYYPYLCECNCGNVTYAKKNELLTGNKVSCGCVHFAYSKSKKMTAQTHGKSNTRLYKVWSAIKDRCMNPNNKNYNEYGGRGISICQGWLNFEEFWTWAYDNGYDEDAEHGKCTIDRIDTNGNYEPSNCRWVDAQAQRLNQRNVKRYEYNGEFKTITEWSRSLSVPYGKLKYWIEEKKLSIEEFLKKHSD